MYVHTYIYIYMIIYVCVCVCICMYVQNERVCHTIWAKMWHPEDPPPLGRPSRHPPALPTVPAARSLDPPRLRRSAPLCCGPADLDHFPLRNVAIEATTKEQIEEFKWDFMGIS